MRGGKQTVIGQTASQPVASCLLYTKESRKRLKAQLLLKLKIAFVSALRVHACNPKLLRTFFWSYIFQNWHRKNRQ